ncbi:hypothetical protein OAK68_00430 [Akkermansiaceae bacterium]|nr:hypothetical protein [Akkermansiaceae bacterium]
MISRTENVRNMRLDRLESGVRDLPFIVVLGLSDISHMYDQGDVSCLVIFFNPFGLPKKAGSLIADLWPMFLSLPVPGIGITLSVRQDDQCEVICWFDSIIGDWRRQRFYLIGKNRSRPQQRPDKPDRLSN